MSGQTSGEIAAGLNEAQRADILGGHWYLAACDACGWIGSSQECGTDWGCGDDSDVYCPVCHAPGADCGSATSQEAAVRQELSNEGGGDAQR